MEGGNIEEVPAEGAGRDGFVDAREARGVQIGDHNTQVIYSYHGTWTDGVAPAPLIGVAGEVESPYRGLGWFSERDAPFFFGRDSAIDALLQRLSHRIRQPGILMVSGVSGAGKSSLLRAGVLPRIRGQGLADMPQAHSWPCLVFTPGHAPLDELALSTAQVAGSDAAVARRELREDPSGFAVLAAQAAHAGPAAEQGGARGLLLVVDQFEQLFTQCPDESQRQAFVAALHAAATTRHAGAVILVVLVVRADFEARCADYESLVDAIQHHYLVTAMTERQLRMAITEPAKQAGARVDDDLVEQLLRETRARRHDSVSAVSAAGVLPLLSHALDRTWRLRAGDTVTVADFERTGGLEGAVADSAQRAYDSLTLPQQRTARRVFTRLVISGSDGTDTADRVHRDDLVWEGVESDDVDAVLAAFTDERLLTVGAQTVEISHEVLLSTWPLLRDTWMADTRENRAVCARLRAAAAEWERHLRDPAYLYSGSVLDTAAAAAEQIAADPARYPPLGDTETQFLTAGIRAQHRRTRQRRAAVGVLMVLVVALAAATLGLFRAGQTSAEQRDNAVSRELAGRSERLAPSDPFGSRVSALAAWRIAPTPEARYAVLAAIRNPAIAILTHVDVLRSMAVRPKSNILATATAADPVDGTVRLWDVANNRPLGEPLHSSWPISEVALSPDGKTLAIGGDNKLQFWDMENNRPLGEPFTGLVGLVGSMAFSPDGKTLAIASLSSAARLWDVASNRPRGEPIRGHTGLVRSVAFSPDGTTLATVGNDPTARLWDVETGRPLGELTDHDGFVRSVAFSPDGKILATAGDDGTTRLWDVEHHRALDKPLTGHDGPVNSITFSPDGTTLATVGDDGTARLWDVEHHRALGEPLTGHDGPVKWVAFGLDGTTLTTGGQDSTIRLWDATGRRPLGEPLTSENTVIGAAAFSPDGTILATGSSRGTVQLWDVEHNRPLGEPLTGHNNSVYSVAFSPDGKTLATGSEDGTARLWDVAGNRPSGEPLTGHKSGIASVAFSPDGKTLATASYDSIRWWNVEDHRPLGEPSTGHKSRARMAFSPDGNTFAVATGDTVRLWDVQGNRPLGDPRTYATPAAGSMAFSPDSATLATGSFDGTVQLWDVTHNRALGEPRTEHRSNITSLAFSPDGKSLASASDDGTVRLWDVQDNRPLGEPLDGHNGLVQTVAFGPDGRILAEVTNGPKVLLHDVGFTVDPAASLCSGTPNWFTREQWDQYVPSDFSPGYRALCP
ncbi:nSTAND1 domain-containing NTPase [Nocardia sp. Marseille-Q1738]